MSVDRPYDEPKGGAFADALSEEELRTFGFFLSSKSFAQGECIFRQGEKSDGCYIIKSGIVRVELEKSDSPKSEVVGLLGPGQLVGEMCLCGMPFRTASIFADTAVDLQWLSMDKFKELGADYPSVAFSFSRFINQDLARKIHQSNTHLMGLISIDNSPKEAASILEKAKSLQSVYTRPEAAGLLSEVPSDKDIIDLVRSKGIKAFCLVADSVFASMDQYLMDLEASGTVIRWVMPSERSIPAVAVGRWLATGELTAMSMQNSGVSNAMDYVRTVMKVHAIPGFLMSSWRGFDEVLDDSEPHILVGNMTDGDSRITFGDDHVFGHRSGIALWKETERALQGVLNGNVVCLRVSPPGFRKTYPLRHCKDEEIRHFNPNRYIELIKGKGLPFSQVMVTPTVTREAALKRIFDEMKDLDAFYIVGNGFNPRVMQALRLTENTFENAGGMGSTLAIAWGAAKSDPNQVFVAIDGDQNALMSEMEKVLSVDYPPNLYWYILNNGTGESVGPSSSLPLSPWHYDLARVINTSNIEPGTFAYDRINASGLKFDSPEAKAISEEIGNLPAQAYLARRILERRRSLRRTNL